jgi:hypothetical protein
MAELDDCNISLPGYLVTNKVRGLHDLASVQNLTISQFRMLK